MKHKYMKITRCNNKALRRLETTQEYSFVKSKIAVKKYLLVIIFGDLK